MITPVFLVLVLGVIEGGLVFYERLSVANMSLAGARTASAQGTDLLADHQVLRTIGSGASGPNSQIRSIVVYRASSTTDRVPVSCKTASVLNSCNRYVAADLAKDTTQFGCLGPPGPVTKIDSYWCPNVRKTAIGGSGGPPDYIGVYVEAVHEDLTGIFGRTITLDTDTIIRMEPRTLI